MGGGDGRLGRILKGIIIYGRTPLKFSGKSTVNCLSNSVCNKITVLLAKVTFLTTADNKILFKLSVMLINE